MTSPEIERRTGLSGAVALKAPVKVATTVNITLVGEQTINGVAVVDGDRVLVKNQTAGADNGIWIASTGDWQRAPDWDANGDVVEGTQVFVTDGSVSPGVLYYVTTADDIVIGTTSVAFSATNFLAGLTSWDAVAAQGTDVASEASLNLDSVTGPILNLTGTIAVTSITLAVGHLRFIRAAAASSFTASANLIVNGSASVSKTNAANDQLVILGGAAGVVYVASIGSAGITFATIAEDLAGISTTKAVNPAGLMTVKARRNRWVNPAFQVSQENSNTLGTTTGYYPADQIAMYFLAATGAMSVQRIQSTRTLKGSLDQIEWKCTTAKASLGVNDFVVLTQNIEGQEMADLQWGTANAKPYVHEFETTRPAGLYHIHVTNSAGNRHIAVPYTITAPEANTQVRKTVTIPGDTSGTWLTTNGIGATIDNVLAAGATVTGGALNTWGATAYYAQATQKNCLDSTSNVVRLADVQLCADIDNTGVAPAWELPDYDDTLRQCQRYFWGVVSYNIGLAVAADALYGHVAFPVEMRAAPVSASLAYAASTGNAGTFQFHAGVGTNPTTQVALVNNSAANWSGSARIRLASGGFNARM